MSKAADYDEVLKSFLRGRNGNFVCAGCGGDIVSIGEKDDRKDFICNGCGQNLKECVVCHFPRSNWGDDGAICSCCAMNALEGKIKLTGEQWKGIAKWAVVIDRPLSGANHKCSQCGAAVNVDPLIASPEPNFKCSECGNTGRL